MQDDLGLGLTNNTTVTHPTYVYSIYSVSVHMSCTVLFVEWSGRLTTFGGVQRRGVTRLYTVILNELQSRQKKRVDSKNIKLGQGESQRDRI